MRYRVTDFDGIGATADGTQLVVRLRGEPRPDAHGHQPIQPIELAMSVEETTQFFNDVLRGALQLAVARPLDLPDPLATQAMVPIPPSEVLASFGSAGEPCLSMSFAGLRLDALLTKAQAAQLARQLEQLQLQASAPAPRGLQ